MYFSELFNIEDVDDQEWFDPILERDTLLFVDPFLIFLDANENWQKMHDKIMDYFHEGFEILAASDLNPKHQFYKRALSLMEFPEPKEFRLGFASKGADGSGSGPGLAQKVVDAMSEAIKRGMRDIRHFEELGILVEGIHRDRISDITCNLLKPEFIKYTQHVCHSLGIPMHTVSVPRSEFNPMRKRWNDSAHLLPVDSSEDKPIILVPKRFLRELPTISADSWFDDLDTALRDDLNLEISTKVRKSEIVDIAKRNRSALRDWISVKERGRPQPYDVSSDPKLLVKWQRVAREAIQEEPFEGTATINSPEELMAFVASIIAKFRHWAEERGGWRVFWKNSAPLEAIPETNMQLLFLGMLDGYCEAAGVRLDREVETGRGPVDFTISADRRMRVLLEMKRLAHGKFWNGLRSQTPVYMKSQKVDQAVFLAIRDSDTRPMQKRWNELDREAERISLDTGFSINVQRVDVLPKQSASKTSPE